MLLEGPRMQVTARYDPHEWIRPGDSVMVDPGQTGVLTAEMGLDRPRRDRMSVDVAAHYGRPDMFWLTVDRHHRPPVALED